MFYSKVNLFLLFSRFFTFYSVSERLSNTTNLFSTYISRVVSRTGDTNEYRTVLDCHPPLVMTLVVQLDEQKPRLGDWIVKRNPPYK